jgi:teichuronic acid biosynthesis glycosyltransferase TuaC
MAHTSPRLLVFSHLFPSLAQPNAGLFIRERMFRVAQHLTIVVVAPQPWFPLQSLVRFFRPHFRPPAARFEVMQGIEVHRPRFLCVPGVLKWSDGFFMAAGSFFTVRRLVKRDRLNAIDAHFGYPDGYAATLLGRWLKLPVMITLRGKEERQLRTDVAKPLRQAILGANRIVCVSWALKDIAVRVGANPDCTSVIGNGIDLSKFRPRPRDEARRALNLPVDAKVLVSVGTLVERKGFHRVIPCLPTLIKNFPDLHYIVVGGAGPEGDNSAALKTLVEAAGLQRNVHFLGPYLPESLPLPLSAADVFVLATSYEGWANVFLEAMACGLPVVTTSVGGNAEVIRSAELGTLVELGNQAALTNALTVALEKSWNRKAIMDYAESNAWERRIPPLLEEFEKLLENAALARTPHAHAPGTGTSAG